MLLTLAQIVSKPNARSAYDALTRLYIDRIGPFHTLETAAFPTEAAFLAWLARPGKLGKAGRTVPIPVLLDSRGRQLSSTDFAGWLGDRRDRGTQHLVFAIGPADGWTPAASSQAQLLLSLGPMTLAHELARLVLAEQLYRACTILAGHPYHSGH